MPTPVYGSNSFTNTPDVNGTPVLLNGGGVAQISSGTFSAIPAAGNTGNLYVDTTNNIILQDGGSAWIPLSKILNVYSTPVAATSGTASLSLSNTTPTTGSGLLIATLTLTPISSNSQFLLMPSVMLSSTTANSNQTLMAFRDSTLVATSLSNITTANNVATSVIHAIDSPATTSSLTYTLRAGTTGGTLYVNSRQGSTSLFGSSPTNNRFLILEIQP